MNIHAHRSAQSWTPIWELDPTAAYALLVVSAPLGRLRSLIQSKTKGMCAACAANEALVMSTAAQACRTRNPLSEAIDRMLVFRYEAYHLEVQCALVSSLRDRMLCAHYLQHNLPGFLCALLYSGEPAKRALGSHLAYTCMLQGLAGCCGGVNTEDIEAGKAKDHPVAPPANVVYLN